MVVSEDARYHTLRPLQPTDFCGFMLSTEDVFKSTQPTQKGLPYALSVHAGIRSHRAHVSERDVEQAGHVGNSSVSGQYERVIDVRQDFEPADV